jgi:hypothetical protein
MFRFRRAMLGAAVAGLTIGAGLAAPVAANAAPAALAGEQTPGCVVGASPYEFIESGLAPKESSVAYIVTVECKPTYGEQSVEIHTPQLSNACQGQLRWYNVAGTTDGDAVVLLDDDGNATAVVLGGPSCAAGKALIEADLTVAPYYTATTYVKIAAPASTKYGLDGPASQVEDSTTSSIATVFYVKFPSVYAEDQVTISDAELWDRCGSLKWYLPNSPTAPEYGKLVTTTLDNNGNAFVIALGSYCASGETLVQADLVGPPYKTVTSQFYILSPRVTVYGQTQE